MLGTQAGTGTTEARDLFPKWVGESNRAHVIQTKHSGLRRWPDYSLFLTALTPSFQTLLGNCSSFSQASVFPQETQGSG